MIIKLPSGIAEEWKNNRSKEAYDAPYQSIENNPKG